MKIQKYLFPCLMFLNAVLIAEPVLIAKSSLILDVKPWDDETDMKMMEDKVREIETDGLKWGASMYCSLTLCVVEFVCHRS